MDGMTVTDVSELKDGEGAVRARMTMEWFQLSYSDVVDLETAKAQHFHALVELGKAKLEKAGG